MVFNCSCNIKIIISQNISNNLNLLIATIFEIDSTLKKLKTTEHRFVQKKKMNELGVCYSG